LLDPSQVVDDLLASMARARVDLDAGRTWNSGVDRCQGSRTAGRCRWFGLGSTWTLANETHEGKAFLA
jgi:hypothetical protein